MERLLRKAVFLDRDGVLNATVVRDGVPHPPAELSEFELLPGVVEATQRLVEAGFSLVVVTNQPDVARGTQIRERVEAMNDVIRARLPVLEVLVCYHDNGDDCPCRKPKPGMLLQAAARWQLDLKQSYMVGDRWSDVVAGQAAGCCTVLIERDFSRRERCSPDWCVANLSAATDWILARGSGFRS